MKSNIAPLYFTEEHCALNIKMMSFFHFLLLFTFFLSYFHQVILSEQLSVQEPPFKADKQYIWWSSFHLDQLNITAYLSEQDSLYSNLSSFPPSCEVLGKFLKLWELCFLTCSVGIMAFASWEFNKLVQRKLFI